MPLHAAGTPYIMLFHLSVGLYLYLLCFVILDCCHKRLVHNIIRSPPVFRVAGAFAVCEDLDAPARPSLSTWFPAAEKISRTRKAELIRLSTGPFQNVDSTESWVVHDVHGVWLDLSCLSTV